MVALQILVLIVGVRILLGELKSADYNRSAFFFYTWSLRLSVEDERFSISKEEFDSPRDHKK